VACTQGLAVAQADDERRRVLRNDDTLRLLAGDDGDRIRALDLAERAPYGVEEALRAGPERSIDEVRDDFRVGIGAESRALGFEHAPQGEVVLDDAVVDERDVADDVRVRVRLGGPA